MSGRGTGSGDISGAVTDDRIYAAGYSDYPIGARPDPKTATPDDFILAFGLKEAIQLTNIDNSDATTPNTPKLWMAIQDATALIDNYIVQASRGGKLLISSNRRRTALIIARYYLDTVRRREDVRTDYEMAIKEIERASSMEDVVRPDPPWWQDVCNPWRGCGVRSHTIPQYYNGVSGKGLSGWWKDSAFLERNDWRYSRLNSEGNNNLPNRRAGTVRKDDDPRLPAQPADDGGIRYSGTSSSAP
jgi:phage gp36-like protein